MSYYNQQQQQPYVGVPPPQGISNIEKSSSFFLFDVCNCWLEVNSCNFHFIIYNLLYMDLLAAGYPPKDAYPPPGYPAEAYAYPPPQYAPPPRQQQHETGLLEGW